MMSYICHRFKRVPKPVEVIEYNIVMDPESGWGELVNMDKCHTCNATMCIAMPEEEFWKMVKKVGEEVQKAPPILKKIEGC